MRIRSLLALIGSSALALLLPACGADHDHAHAADSAAVWKDVKELVCVLHPTAGNTCSGVVRFTTAGQGVKVVAEVQGLKPNQKHAIHVHEFGDCSAADATSAGAHYDPDQHKHHGDPAKDAKRHAGDLGNLTADAEGKCRYEVTVDNATLVGTNPLIGLGVIVHEKEDDFTTQPTGNAGGRIACGVIGVAKR